MHSVLRYSWLRIQLQVIPDTDNAKDEKKYKNSRNISHGFLSFPIVLVDFYRIYTIREKIARKK